MYFKSCPSCMKTVIHEELRMAEMPPTEVIGYNKTRMKTVVGRIYYHKDGTICDQANYVLRKLPKPKFLRLGDSRRDPRT